jgi:hypothetical protein
MLLTNSKIITFMPQSINRIMKNNVLKTIYAVFMAAVAVAIIVFMIIHLTSGNGGQYSKLMTAAYVLLFIWAAYRCYNIFKSLRK